MIIVWTVIITLLCVSQLTGMVWAWNYTRLLSALSRHKRMLLIVLWPILVLWAYFGRVQ